jgi:hypothetical protein
MSNIQKKIAALVSVSCVILAVIAYTFYVSGHMLFCSYDYKYFYIYTDAFEYGSLSNCNDAIESLSKNTTILFLLVATATALFIILAEERFKKLFKRFIKVFFPIGITILVIGWFSSFCIMWSCSDGVTPAIKIDLFILLLVIFTISWSTLLPTEGQKLGVVLLVVLPVALFFSLEKLDYIVQRPIYSSIDAIESNNVGICPKITKKLEQSCIQQVAIGLRDEEICKKIPEGTASGFCLNAVEEQIAIDKKNPLVCNNITELSWRNRCVERLKY